MLSWEGLLALVPTARLEPNGGWSRVVTREQCGGSFCDLFFESKWEDLMLNEGFNI